MHTLSYINAKYSTRNKKDLAIFKKRGGLQSAILLPVAILKIATSCLHAILIMRGTVLCDVTERQTGAVKMEEIKLLVTSKNLAMLLMVVTGM